MGEPAIKREFILDGLDCASCAAKIENGVRGLEDVSACSLNFVTKTLTVETVSGKDEQVAEEAKRLVKRLEPHVEVKEKRAAAAKQVLLLQGLDCANCAAKIERQTGELAGMASSTLDFVSKRLILEAEDRRQLPELVKQATAIVKKLEPHVEVVPEEARKPEEHDHGAGELRRSLARLSAGAVLTGMAAFAPLAFPYDLALFVLAYVIVGGDIVLRAFRNILRGQVFDENFLMAIATLGAFAIGEYPEAVAVMLFYQIGELFQSLAVNRSRRSITALMDIRPEYANVRVGAEIRQLPPEDVCIGDIIIVKPGEKVPLDGRVLEGTAMLDTSALTGESVPREAGAGSEVLGGFINKNGVLTVQVTKEFGESAVSKILDLVQNASSRKAPTEHFITKFARYYTPFVVITAAVLAFLPPLFISGAALSDWVYRALVFLVISCPCALVVSIPLGFFGGIGGASKRGILVKGSNYLEALNDVKYVVFDKTGTLTKGVFEVTSIRPAGGLTEEQLLEYAALAEAHSNHPIAVSIRKAYGKEMPEVQSYEEIAGHGTKVQAGGADILAGNAKLMVREGILFTAPDEAGTVVHVAVNGKYAGFLVISDEVKEDASEAIAALKELGVKRTVMLTGDAAAVGEAVGKELGLDEVHAELLPHQKVEQVEALDAKKQKREKIVFVGDGINDTPVLARADIGIAMGGLGSDAAIEAADIVIMTDEPSKIATAIGVAKRTRRIVYQNIIFALGVKAVFLLLGAFGIATMWEAVFSDVGVTLLAVLNAMRVMKVENL
ncbi:heavy metal translocating P-type ATPase [Ectobacillus ponti]|uniref:Heavy metal translocating P-type ATPase n=1 Tax=Ectobacillus ponti TaxID=2961894 RepID=A0AA41X724_9BACI|nr:heavy metal translocating P-type ATPase [Ectobacillus ponti]MCP8970022.1 heavy metal translocating P-type ATPase [Ectobacillus ponti]